METILGLYLVGWFISFGISLGMKDEDESWPEALGLAVFLGVMSWISVGMVIGELHNKHIKDETKNKEDESD